MKVYISLPVARTKDYKARAKMIENALKAEGHTVINPVTICEGLPQGTTHKQYMDICLTLVDMCEAIVFDEGWENSRGCNLEMIRAMKNKIAIGFIGEHTWESQNRQEHTNLQRLPGSRSILGAATSAFSVLRTTICRVPHGMQSRY